MAEISIPIPFEVEQAARELGACSAGTAQVSDLGHIIEPLHTRETRKGVPVIVLSRHDTILMRKMKSLRGYPRTR